MATIFKMNSTTIHYSVRIFLKMRICSVSLKIQFAKYLRFCSLNKRIKIQRHYLLIKLYFIISSAAIYFFTVLKKQFTQLMIREGQCGQSAHLRICDMCFQLNLLNLNHGTTIQNFLQLCLGGANQDGHRKIVQQLFPSGQSLLGLQLLIQFF